VDALHLAFAEYTPFLSTNMALPVPQILLLLLLAALGFWTLWGFPYTNGLLKILADLHRPGASIPGPTFAPMRQRYTGIKIFDAQLTTLVGFFFTAVDGNRADVSLIGLDFGAQVVAAWMLITIEGLRFGNRGKWYITATTFLGVLLQNIGFGCIAPIWMAIHLATSPTVLNPDVDELVVSPLQLAVAPISILIAYGVPSIMMCLPAPAKISFDAKQGWTGAQQLWPIWIAIAQVILTTVVAIFNPMVNVITEDARKTKTLTYLRYAYAFALVASTAGHLTSWGLSLLTYAFPGLFAQKYESIMLPWDVFWPVWPFGPRQADTLADGALWFLQWDLITSTAAVLLWTFTLRVGVEGRQTQLWQWIAGLTLSAIISVFVGPVGAAVLSLWARDEIVFGRWAKEKEEEALAKKST
jgi:hypothetical protein